ncbi:hypothetical protein O3P69_013473 [Scylla paramamosain]|uniref:Uncharacterized protein n=1 Tax=Scylla paramamosain TaxID=85552 RepID=A0AAW0SB45_SCYPA
MKDGITKHASGGYLASTTGSTFLGGSESDGDEGFLQGDGKEMQASFKRKYMYSSKREVRMLHLALVMNLHQHLNGSQE